MNEGWRCPTCGGVYAPFVQKCWTCPPSYSSSTITIHDLCGCGCPTDTGGNKVHSPNCPQRFYSIEAES